MPYKSFNKIIPDATFLQYIRHYYKGDKGL